MTNADWEILTEYFAKTGYVVWLALVVPVMTKDGPGGMLALSISCFLPWVAGRIITVYVCVKELVTRYFADASTLFIATLLENKYGPQR